MASIRKRSEGQWEVRVRRRGYPVVCRTFATKRDAEAWAAVTESEMVRGVHVDRSEAERTPLKEVLVRYELEILPRKKENTRYKEGYIARMWQRQDLALRALARVRPADLVTWREDRLKKVGPKTVRNELLLLRHVFEMATKEFGIEGLTNPIARISLPSPGKARDRRLEMGEAERLLAAAQRNENIWIGALIALAVETGARRGELANLTWDDVSLGRRTAILRDTKNGDDRAIPLSSKAVRILEGLPRNIDGRVFPLEPDSITQAFTRVRAAAGLPDIHFHDLRHEAISRLFELGLNPMEVASISGHKTLQMLKRYTHLRAEDLARKLG